MTEKKKPPIDSPTAYARAVAGHGPRSPGIVARLCELHLAMLETPPPGVVYSDGKWIGPGGEVVFDLRPLFPEIGS